MKKPNALFGRPVAVRVTSLSATVREPIARISLVIPVELTLAMQYGEPMPPVLTPAPETIIS